MQAITGSGDVVEDGAKGREEQEISDLLERKEYELDPACLPYTQGRTEMGGIRLNAGDLDDIFDVLIAGIFGDQFVGECPETALRPSSETGYGRIESEKLPDGLLLDQLQIYNLNGDESALSIFGLPSDGGERQRLELSDKAVDSTQLKQFAAGWRVEVEGPLDMEICIAHPPIGAFDDASVLVELQSGPSEPEASQDVSIFKVDLSDVPIIRKAESEGRSVNGLLVGFGVDPENQQEWTASWSGGTNAELVFEPRSEGTFATVNLWIEVETGAGGLPTRIPVKVRSSRQSKRWRLPEH